MIALTTTMSAASTPTLSPVIEKAEAAKSGPEASPIAARKNSSPSWRMVELAACGSPHTKGPVRPTHPRTMPTTSGPAATPSRSVMPPGSGIATSPRSTPSAMPAPTEKASIWAMERSESPNQSAAFSSSSLGTTASTRSPSSRTRSSRASRSRSPRLTRVMTPWKRPGMSTSAIVRPATRVEETVRRRKSTAVRSLARQLWSPVPRSCMADSTAAGAPTMTTLSPGSSSSPGATTRVSPSRSR